MLMPYLWMFLYFICKLLLHGVVKEAFRDDLNRSSAACDHSVERELCSAALQSLTQKGRISSARGVPEGRQRRDTHQQMTFCRSPKRTLFPQHSETL